MIESSGISEPLPVAETFTFKDPSGTSLSDIGDASGNVRNFQSQCGVRSGFCGPGSGSGSGKAKAQAGPGRSALLQLYFLIKIKSRNRLWEMSFF